MNRAAPSLHAAASRFFSTQLPKYGAALIFLISLFALKLHLDSATTLIVDIESAGGSSIQVYYKDSVDSFSETKSVRRPLTGSKRRSYLFHIPTASSLRLDPTDAASEIRIHSISLHSAFRSLNWNTSNKFVGWNALGSSAKTERRDNHLMVSPIGSDPAIVIDGVGPSKKISAALVALASSSLLIWLFLSGVFTCATDLKSGLLADRPSSPISCSRILLGSFVVFLLCVLLRIHGSSINQWNLITKGEISNSDEFILGTPRSVRSDEWLVFSTAIFAQLNHTPPFPDSNPSVGASNAPLTFGLPVKHWSMLFRPQLWGFFLLGKQTAFSWWWNFRLFSMFVGIFLVFRQIARENSSVAFGCALLFLYSSYTQWWLSSSLTELVGAWSIALYSLVELMRSSTKRRQILFSLLLSWSAIWFGITLYPPFQIGLAWLGLLLAGTFALSEWHKWRGNLRTNLAFLSACAVITSLFFWLYIQDIAPTIEIMTQTAYPGSRMELGGTISFSQIMLGVFNLFLSEDRFPKFLGNACEAGGYLILWPIVAIAVAYSYYRTREIDKFNLSLLLICILWTAYMSIGIPQWAAKYSLLSQVPAARVLLPLGIASIAAVARLLSTQSTVRMPIFAAASLALLAAIGTYTLGAEIRAQDLTFFTVERVFSVAFISFVLSLLILRRHAGPALICLGAFSLIPNHLVNPIVSGTTAVTENSLVKLGTKLKTIDPEATLLVFDDMTHGALIRSGGVNVFNGAKFVPNLDAMKTLDPKGEYSSVYNRFAHIVVHPTAAEVETAKFNLIQADLYTIEIAPCSPLLGKLVKYVLFLSEPASSLDLSCYERVNEVDRRWKLYKRM